MRNALKITTTAEYAVLDLDAPAGSLKVLQDAVDGLIEPVALTPALEMYVNEEGLFRDDLAGNAWVALMTGRLIKGDVVITGAVDDEGETIGLTDEQIASLVNYSLG